MHEQARNSDAYIAYGNETSKTRANNWSLIIQYLLVGENKAAQELLPNNPEFQPIKDQDLRVTLSDFIEAVEGQPLVATVPANRQYMDLFYVQVISNSFSGRVVAAPNTTSTSITKYINVFAYPPRPALGTYSLTEKQLVDWASNDEKYQGEYLPPSPYIPIANS